MNPDRSASSAGVSLLPSRLASGTTTPMRLVCGRLINRGMGAGLLVDVASKGSPSGSRGLQLGAEEFASVGVNVLDFQPLRFGGGSIV